MRYATGLMAASGQMHWDLGDGRPNEKEGLTITIHLRSFTELAPLLSPGWQQEMLAVLREMLKKGNVTWASPGDEEWSIDLDALKDWLKIYFPDLSSLQWFSGQALIRPEIRVDGREVFDEQRYDVSAIFRLTPEATLTKDIQQRRLKEAYGVLSRLEQSLRNLIQAKLREVYGDSWWERGVPDQVRGSCEQRKQEKEKPEEALHHPIYYAYVDDYRSIIMRHNNWRDVFAPVFVKRTELEACFAWVTRVRDAVAHVRPLSEEDLKNFLFGAQWLQGAMDRSN
jgi:hypothetical protein